MLSAVNYYLSEILSLLIYLVYKNGFYLYFVPRIFIQQDKREKKPFIGRFEFQCRKVMTSLLHRSAKRYA